MAWHSLLSRSARWERGMEYMQKYRKNRNTATSYRTFHKLQHTPEATGRSTSAQTLLCLFNYLTKNDWDILEHFGNMFGSFRRSGRLLGGLWWLRDAFGLPPGAS